MTMYLDRDGWDVATWILINEPAGAGTVDVQIQGIWYPVAVTGGVASLQVCGPDYAGTTPPVEDCVTIAANVLPRIRDRGIIRTDEWIKLR